MRDLLFLTAHVAGRFAFWAALAAVALAFRSCA